MAEAAVDTRRETANFLHELGLTLVPAHPTEKRPLISWARYQNDDVPDELWDVWTSTAQFESCNWAVLTGRHINVVDADSDEAVNWVKTHLPHSPWRVKTARGVHFYYAANPSFPVSNSTNPDVAVDVRGQGGLVIAPGSLHASGCRYTMDVDSGFKVDWRDLPMLDASDLRKINSFNSPSPTAVTIGWHDNMIREVGHLVSTGSTDEQILSLAPTYQETGYSLEETIEEIKVAIAGARSKGWEPESDVEVPEPESETAPASSAVVAEVLPDFLEARLPKREWVYGRHYIRKYLSVTLAAGGTGKTVLACCEAVAMASGKGFMGIDVPEPLRVWMWNLEDPMSEMIRRIAGVMRHYELTSHDLGGRLYVNSGRDRPLTVAREFGGKIVVLPDVDEIIAEIQRKKIDVIVVDPFIGSHEVDENKNTAIGQVAMAWGRVAEEGNCSVEIVHHVRKGGTGGFAEPTVDDGRGASALNSAARHVRRLVRMTLAEARDSGLDTDDYWRFSREADSKDNLAPPSSDSTWRKMVSMKLENGDNVGVMEPWAWPDPWADVSLVNLKEVQRAVAGKGLRFDRRAKTWAGNVVADILDIDLAEPGVRSKVGALLNGWIETGVLIVEERRAGDRKMKKFIEVGDWVE